MSEINKKERSKLRRGIRTITAASTWMVLTGSTLLFLFWVAKELPKDPGWLSLPIIIALLFWGTKATMYLLNVTERWFYHGKEGDNDKG